MVALWCVALLRYRPPGVRDKAHRTLPFGPLLEHCCLASPYTLAKSFPTAIILTAVSTIDVVICALTSADARLPTRLRVGFSFNTIFEAIYRPVQSSIQKLVLGPMNASPDLRHAGGVGATRHRSCPIWRRRSAALVRSVEGTDIFSAL
ncbi:unnamed protein product, partial [Ectocarpus sp. 8 AP-2014]